MAVSSIVTILADRRSAACRSREVHSLHGLREDLIRRLSEDYYLHCLQRLPERIVEKAVKGMLPSGRIGRHLFTHLKVQCPVSASVTMKCCAAATPVGVVPAVGVMCESFLVML